MLVKKSVWLINTFGVNVVKMHRSEQSEQKVSQVLIFGRVLAMPQLDMENQAQIVVILRHKLGLVRH